MTKWIFQVWYSASDIEYILVKADTRQDAEEFVNNMFEDWAYIDYATKEFTIES